jgi:biotin transport system substrate-specific component
MIRMSAAARTLLDTAWPQDNTTRRVGMVVAVVFGVCLLTLSAKIQVPFWPVPMTMQTLVVLMLGMAYGSRLAVGTARCWRTCWRVPSGCRYSRARPSAASVSPT